MKAKKHGQSWDIGFGVIVKQYYFSWGAQI